MSDARYPSTRLRRNRTDGWTRALVAEHRLAVSDLIWPIFVRDGTGGPEPVASMPGVFRTTLDGLEAHAAPAADLGIRRSRCFPSPPRR